MTWFPDRTWAGRTFVPVTTRTSAGYDLTAMSRSRPATPTTSPATSTRGPTSPTRPPSANPDWKMDLCEEVIGGWRGENGEVAAMTLVWGVPMVRGGATATAELAGLTVDQCKVAENRFTLLAPDAYRGDYLEIALWDGSGDRAGPRVALRGRRRGRDDAVAVPVAVLHHAVHEPVLARLLGREEAVALEHVGDVLDGPARVLGVDLLDAPAQLERLLRVDLDVGRLALEAAAGLVDEDPRVRAAPTACRARRRPAAASPSTSRCRSTRSPRRA